MAATSKTKRTARAKTAKKTSRTAARKRKSARNSTSRASASKAKSTASAKSRSSAKSRTSAKKSRAKTASKRTPRKAPVRKRAARKTATATSTRKRTPKVAATNTTSADRRFLKEHADELSPSTERAKWIHSPDEREDRPGQTLATRSHDVIEHWAEERGAAPATVPGTEHGGGPGVLRLDFPGYGGGQLQHIGWDQWFAPFDGRQLVFVFQQHTADGRQSNFFRLDSPSRE